LLQASWRAPRTQVLRAAHRAQWPAPRWPVLQNISSWSRASCIAPSTSSLVPVSFGYSSSRPLPAIAFISKTTPMASASELNSSAAMSLTKSYTKNIHLSTFFVPDLSTPISKRNSTDLIVFVPVPIVPIVSTMLLLPLNQSGSIPVAEVPMLVLQRSGTKKVERCIFLV